MKLITDTGEKNVHLSNHDGCCVAARIQEHRYEGVNLQQFGDTIVVPHQKFDEIMADLKAGTPPIR